MREALSLAQTSLGISSPNPSVGCVIVRDGRVIGRGATRPAGQNHAEIEAIEDALAHGESVAGSTVYVTLEPCSHFGRTPPCAKRLVHERVSRVVAATVDPNPAVAGRGFAILKSAGIAVDVGLFEKEARFLNRDFFFKMKTGKPWVRLKTAISLDAKTALKNGESQWITGEAARRDARRFRAISGAVITGSGTVTSDNPRMTARLECEGAPEPWRVVLDTKMALDPTARIFEGGRALWCVGEVNPEKRDAASKNGIELYVAAKKGEHLDLEDVLTRVAALDVNGIMIEAGATLSGAFLAANLVNEILAYVAPVVIGPGRDAFTIPALVRLSEAKRFQLADCTRLAEDLRLTLITKEN